MMQKIDMSPEAVTGRMIALDQLWELSVALRSSTIVKEAREEDRMKPAAALTQDKEVVDS